MTAFDNFCTIRNRNEYSTNQAYTLSLQLYMVKLKIGLAQNGRLLTAVRSVEPIVPNLQKFFQCSIRFFPSLLENSFSSLPAENILHLLWFLSEIYLKTQYG